MRGTGRIENLFLGEDLPKQVRQILCAERTPLLFVTPATVPKTNARMPDANKACRITQAMPEPALFPSCSRYRALFCFCQFKRSASSCLISHSIREKMLNL